MANLFIVESPSKATTIQGYLGSNYKVMASKGHVRDLPKSSLGVDIDNNFAAHYINIRGKGDLIKELKKEAKKANIVYLAGDPDREGEAISWHLANALDIPAENIRRITFNVVTKAAVKDALKHPRNIDMDIVNSQQARRILDRIVGYKISPFLWKTVKSGLSAGRVQSVATRMIVERENEIRAFKSEEYWTIEALLGNEKNKAIKAKFYGNKEGRIELKNESEADEIVKAVDGKVFTVANVKKATKQKAPTPPFTTSTLQQEASKKLGFQSQRIMRIAQELYEGVNLGSEFGGVHGLITYMRTDSLRVSSEASEAAEAYIKEKYGAEYYPEKPREYTSKANAQDAHEAVRPASMAFEPAKIRKSLSLEQYKLYKLIWERFVASQMASAVMDTVTVNFECGDYVFRSNGYTVTFPGYRAVYEESVDDPKADDIDEPQKNNRLPVLNGGELMQLEGVTPAQHFTEPPPHFTEGSLVKFLEEKGIGRPSTFTPIITTIIARSYVKREGQSLVPTQLGEITTQLMIENFPEIVDYTFTANMESRLDEIESGNVDMTDVLTDFYKDFKEELDSASEKIGTNNIEVPVEETDIICEKCGSKMVVKNGRFGKFAACPNYPTCKNTKPLDKDGKVAEKKEKETIIADFKCELCGSDVVLRTGRYGSFYACSSYPKCKFTKQFNKTIGVACPKCGAQVVTRYGKKHNVYYSCERYPDCDFSSWDLPLEEKCPKCGKTLFRKKGKNLIVCADRECGYKKETEPAENEG